MVSDSIKPAGFEMCEFPARKQNFVFAEKKQTHFITSGRSYCDPSCLLVGSFVRLFVGVFVNVFVL